MKMKVVDVIRKTSDEEIATIIGAIVVIEYFAIGTAEECRAAAERMSNYVEFKKEEGR